MLIGIDVGGTYTDGVALTENGEMIAFAKYPTFYNRLLESVTGCLDQIMKNIKPAQVTRVSLSTTLLTNAILQRDLSKICMLVMPGPGISPADINLGVQKEILPGAIDFRGREVVPLDTVALAKIMTKVAAGQYQGVAVTGKFSQRNNYHEIAVESYVHDNFPSLTVELGHRLYGGLNFPRRANTAYLTAAVRPLFRSFLAQTEAALQDRGIRAPLYIVKADGGALPVASALHKPVETIYSGPAAGVLGVLALQSKNENSIIMDIGGTTTDLGLILSGKPLLASKGAEIGLFQTQVRSFAFRSVAVGGDSPVVVDQGNLMLKTKRVGPAFCLGGPLPTLTDALRYLDLCKYGDKDLAREAILKIQEDTGIDAKQVAQQIVELAVQRICRAIQDIIAVWEREPVYRVWQVLHPHRLNGFKIIGVGGGAPGLTSLVARCLNTGYELPKHGKLANALGAALARPTFSCSIRVDTVQGIYSIAESGEQLPWKYGKSNLNKAKEVMQDHFNAMAAELKLEHTEAELTREEVFNIVRGFATEGKIMEVAMELQAGVLTHVQEGINDAE